MSRSYPWRDSRPEPEHVVTPEEHAEVMRELRAFRDKLPGPRMRAVPPPEPLQLPECPECVEHGIALCGEHGLERLRRPAEQGELF